VYDAADILQEPMDKPLISVIVAVFNGARTLQRCIDSVVGQSYPNKELLVIDGASTDGTLRILQQQVEKLDYWESAPDRGIYHAWNKALSHVHGEWVCFLGADDFLWDNATLERLVPHLTAAYPSTRVVYCKAALVASDGRVVEIRGEPWQRASGPFLQGVPSSSVPHQGVLHHRSIFQETGLFDESFRIAGDFELLLRTLRDSDPLFVPNVVMAGMEHGGISTNAQNALESLREAYRARKMNDIQGTPFLWYWTYAKAKARDFLVQTAGDWIARHATNLYRRLTGRQSI
jgi:glycosyltransferase involved in cell wall biosynthesis